MRTLNRSQGRTVFGEDAAGYDAGRLGYPEELYELLFDVAGPPADLSVFEVGPGTGLATRSLLAAHPKRLVALEPDPALADHLRGAFPEQLEVETGAFEDNCLPSGSFGLGVAAASFHWLDAEKGFRQVRRLLRPGGCWAMWWNVYRAVGIGDAFADEVTPLLSGLALPPSETRHGHISLDRSYQHEVLHRHGFGGVRTAVFRRERTLDAQAVRSLYASYSFIRALPPAEKESLLDGLADLAERQFAGGAPNVVLTPVYLAIAP